MKKWWIIGYLIVFLGACTSSGQYHILVEGLTPYEGKPVYLFQEGLNDPFLMDTLASGIIHTGKVEFCGKVEFPDQVTLVVVDEGRFPVVFRFILEAGKLRLSPDPHKEFRVNGGRYNDEIINSWKYTSLYDSLMQQYLLEDNMAKTEEEEQNALTLFRQANKFRSKALTLLAKNGTDPMGRLLAVINGGLTENGEKVKVIEKVEQEMGVTPTSSRWKAFYQSCLERDLIKQRLRPGGQYIDFSASDLQGKNYCLKEILKNNRYVLIEFWASWCKPCRAEIPYLKETYHKYHDKGFEIVAFSLDKERQKWFRASEEEDISWINLSDLKGLGSYIVKAYGITGIPANFMLEAETGKIVATDLRQHQLREELGKRMN